MITTNLTGNFGNHAWQYAVCRTVAEKLGYQWGISPITSHDYFGGASQFYFMNFDFGERVKNIEHEYHEPWKTIYHVDEVNITMLDPNIYNIQDNTIILGHNGAKGAILQSENYIIDRKEDIKEWFRIKPEFAEQYGAKMKELGVILDDNTCVINFRGGEYRGIPNVLCRREYWRDSVNHMLSINPDMKFLVITDDVDCANAFMPFPIRCVHVDVGFDYYVLFKAKWLIISNSTFGWWPAWLSESANKIIAPKYWARGNVSDGYWSVGESYTRGFDYMGRDSKLYDYETCKTEAQQYYKEKNLI